MGVRQLKGQFDQDGDGVLDDQERKRARQAARQGRGGGRAFPASPPEAKENGRGRNLGVDDVTAHPTADLFDPSVLRTLFLDFENDDWEAELSDFWKTDVDVPAQLSVDRTPIGTIGVRFRGTSSFFTVAPGQKRSMNLAIDYGQSKQRLHGYKTLNLLNAHTDPTFLRSVLFNHIAGHYLPSPQANFVHLVINRESWGIYVNSEQFNKDFLSKHFKTRKGVRWKMMPNPRGGNGLAYEGDRISAYEGRYVMKSDGGDAGWHQLIRVFKVLNKTPPEDLVDALNPIFNIDRALWFLALENVFVDNDGYWVRASDFSMYTDPDGRLHLVPHDSNETFRKPGGPGFNGDPEKGLDPLFGLSDENKPLIHRLLKVPDLKARYLAHVRTLRDNWLDWGRIGALVDPYQALIHSEIQQDTRKHEGYEVFKKAVTEDTTGVGFRGPTRRISLKGFVEQRRRYLDEYEAFQPAPPKIVSVQHRGNGSDPVRPLEIATIELRTEENPDVESALLYFSHRKHGVYQSVAMAKRESTRFTATIPPQAVGEKMFYYVAARRNESKTVTFFPRNTEFGALSYRVEPERATQSPLWITEVMASNTRTIADADGNFDDWIEISNRTDDELDLSGYWLSDNPRHPRKWRFPEGARLAPNGTVMVWADEDGESTASEFHTNFKLSKKGESIGLYDRDTQSNRQLDLVSFGPLEDDQSWRRPGTESNDLLIISPSPGKPN